MIIGKSVIGGRIDILISLVMILVTRTVTAARKKQAPGYEVEPTNRSDDGKYPLINFCSAFW